MYKKDIILTAKEKEIQELDIKKNELEYLVRKVSMNLFLKDQLERSELRIVEIIEENSELNKLLGQRTRIIS